MAAAALVHMQVVYVDWCKAKQTLQKMQQNFSNFMVVRVEEFTFFSFCLSCSETKKRCWVYIQPFEEMENQAAVSTFILNSSYLIILDGFT